MDPESYQPLQPTPKLPAWKAVALVWLPSFAAFVVAEMLWMAAVIGQPFAEALGDLARPGGPNLAVQALSWAALVAGVWHFASRGSSSARHALVEGTLLGLVVHVCYEATNLALITSWTWRIAGIECVWGAVSCGATAALQHWLCTLVARTTA